MKSSFLGGAYAVRSLPLAAQSAVNLYLEPNESGSGDAGAFYGTPGLRTVATLAGGAHRAQLKAGGYDWCVVGANVYRVASDYTYTLVTTLPNSTGPVDMDENGVQLGIAHPGGWHVIVMATLAVQVVVDAPKTSDISFLDNYGLGAADNGTYVWTNLADFSVIPALNFASAEGSPDKVIRTIADHREGWLFGEKTTEVIVINGDPDLPFTRTTFIEQGILAPRSAAKSDNSVFWLGCNDDGQGVIYRADGYVPTRISTFAIEQAIAADDAVDASAYTYQQDGHHFYVLCLSGSTWAYDINTQLWHQRAYLNPLTGDREAHRAVTHAMFNGVHLVGDRVDGRLYVLDMGTYTDDGAPIYRERAWREQDADDHLATATSAQLIADMGVGLDSSSDATGLDPQVYLSWSYDGTRTWSSPIARSLGRIGQYRLRARWLRLGASRRRDWRLYTAAPVRICWRAFLFNGEVCSA